MMSRSTHHLLRRCNAVMLVRPASSSTTSASASPFVTNDSSSHGGNREVSRSSLFGTAKDFERKVNKKFSTAMSATDLTITDPESEDVMEILNGSVKMPFQTVAFERTSGERLYRFDDLPSVPFETFSENNEETAAWIASLVQHNDGVTFYVGFEAFYDPSFEQFAASLPTDGSCRLSFSPQTKITVEYIRNRERYEAMERAVGAASSSSQSEDNGLVVHLGAAHVMDTIVFGDDDGHHQLLQHAWQDGRMVLLAPSLAVTDTISYRAGLSPVLQKLSVMLGDTGDNAFDVDKQLSSSVCRKNKTITEQYKIDTEIEKVRAAVMDSECMDDIFTTVFGFVSKQVAEENRDLPFYWDVGSECFRLLQRVRSDLAEQDLTLPFTKASLTNIRNSAIGDAVHSFYASDPSSFPFVVTGDTAALLAGGISLINIFSKQRYGVVVLLNNQGMEIEDNISKRSVDGHQFQYDYVKLENKKDIFTLDQLKETIVKDVMGQLRDYCWGVEPHRQEAVVLNIDVKSIRQDVLRRQGLPSVQEKRSYLDGDFGKRFQKLAEPRKQLETVVDVLYEANDGNPVKIQACSAVEFMEIFSQLAITSQSKMEYQPMPTDLLATRTLLPSLVGGGRTSSDAYSSGKKTLKNANKKFSVLVSNAVFGTDGLNNAVATQLENGSDTTLVHLVYDAASVVSRYSQIGQVHRQFGVRPSALVPGLYARHAAHSSQVLFGRADSDGDDSATEVLLVGLNDPNCRAVVIDMGAPNLTDQI